jgi:hypothetical protein
MKHRPFPTLRACADEESKRATLRQDGLTGDAYDLAHIHLRKEMHRSR